MKINLRKWHRWIGLLITLPLLIVTLTGIILLLRNKFETIQPKPISSKLDNSALMTLETVTKKFGEENIEQIIYRPQKKSLAVRLKNGEEVQLHPQTGVVFKKSIRRTTFLIELHQGSWLGSFGQYFIHILTGIGLLFLIVSGLFIYPFKQRRSL